MKIFQYILGACVLASTLYPCQTQAAPSPPPRSLVARSFSSNAPPQINFQIDLSWIDATPNESSFSLVFSNRANFAPSTVIPNIPRNSTHYSHTGLTASKTYWYKIRAITPQGVTSYSNTAAAVAGTPIGPLFFGQNAWLPDKVGEQEPGGDLEKLLCGVNYNSPGDACVPAEVQASGVKLMRYGGKTVDEHYNSELSLDQYLTMVDNMRANGIEPLLQVPYFNGAYGNISESAVLAAELVQDIKTNHRSVTYLTIGNEPNETYGAGGDTAADIASYFQPLAMAMRDVDPNIAIVGPDLSYYDYPGVAPTVMDDLTDPDPTNVDSLCGFETDDFGNAVIGTNGKRRFYLDIIDFHTYPFGRDTATYTRSRADIIAKPQGDFEDDVIALKERVYDCNDVYERYGTEELRIAVTETNLEYQDQFACDPDGLDPAVPDDCDLSPEGLNGQSFLAGQYWADMMNVGMKHGLEFIAFWSIKERNAPRGYITNNDDETGFIKLSTYYHYQMLAQNFRGVYAEGDLNGNAVNVKAFGAKDVDQIVVMLLNQKQRPQPPLLSLLPYTVRLNNDQVAGNSALKVNIDADVAQQYSGLLGAESTVMLVFDANGNFLRRYVYDLSNAQIDTEPSCIGATCPAARQPAPRRPAPPRRPRSPTERSE